jgi:leucyl aminopeptidase
MFEEALPCVTADRSARPVHVLRSAGLPAFLATLPPPQRAGLRDAGFAARACELALQPGPDGIECAVFGLGDGGSPFSFGDLPFRLPLATAWRLVPGDYDMDDAVLGYCLGAYRYRRFKSPPREAARLALDGAATRPRSLAAAMWMVRDLINTPANLLGPAELADVVIALADRHGASPLRVDGATLAREYPAIAAVGAGSVRPPVVAGFAWRGSRATNDSPLIALCGKGVCFDTGGYDIKPADGMLKMKKDMGGAASVLGIARVLMEADLPLRLLVRVGCVENSISGAAMRPSDVIQTRRGHAVEVGNTDAEGRLVLADLLAEASDARPALLLDCATLTGAARVALGPDIVAMFANDHDWAERLADASRIRNDPIWRLPIWDGYDNYLDSAIADLNNVSTKPFAGAVIAALFLRRFVAADIPWIHLDMYAWNDATRPGRPEGGESQALRAICFAIENKLSVTTADRNTAVT